MKQQLLHFLGSGHHFDDNDRSLLYKHRFVNSVIVVSGILVTLFGIWRLYTGHSPLIGIIDLAFGCLVLGIIVTLRKSPPKKIESIATFVLGLCFSAAFLFYIFVQETVRIGPVFLMIASAYFLKGNRAGMFCSALSIVAMLTIELIPWSYGKGWYGTLTCMLEIACMMILLTLYEHQRQDDANQIRNNETRFRRIFDSSDDAILLLKNERCTQWNRRSISLFQCSNEFLGDQPLMGFVSTSNSPGTFLQVEEAILASHRGITIPIELLLKRQTGEDFYANLRLSLVGLGTTEFVQVTIRDIDAQKRGEIELTGYREDLEQLVRERTKRLEESEIRFSRLLELTEEGIYTHEKGIIVDATNAFCRLTGYRKSELIGRNFLDFLLAPESLQTVRDYMAARAGHAYEITILHQDGRRIVVEALGRDMDYQGRPLRAGVWRDITVRKETERALRAAQQAAEEANRAKSAFVANMSHEIRTPLNAIIGIAHQLQRDADDNADNARLGRIGGAAQHLLLILTDILDISKIEAGKLDLEKTPFSIKKLVDNACDIVRDSAEQKNLTLRALLDDRLPPALLGDPVRLSQVLVNLLANAIKFTEHGGVSLWVSTIRATDEEITLRFRISDTGIGISEEQKNRIFNVFEQAESSTSRRFGGTGLGLSISRRLVELMGGQLECRSDVGKGSEFHFQITLPRTDELASNNGNALETVEPEEMKRRFSNARILLVEDSPINREVALDFLNEAGLHADTAENGQQAVEAVCEHPYDLVLMDMQMPIMDGLSATRAIRAFPQFAKLPIIAMTANAYPEDREQCLQAGMNDYLAKPVEPEIFYAKLAKWLHSDSTLEQPIAVVSNEPAPATTPTASPDLIAQEHLFQLADCAGFQGITDITLAQLKPERYFELLHEFFLTHGNDSQLIEKVITTNSDTAPDEARQLAHTLKGVASILGLTPIAAAAGEMQNLLMDSESSAASSAGDIHQQLLQSSRSTHEIIQQMYVQAKAIVFDAKE